MKFTHIPFHKTGFFSKTMTDYLDQKKDLDQYISYFPNEENSIIEISGINFDVNNSLIMNASGI